MAVLEIRVKTGQRAQALTEQPNGTWLASLKARPVDGAANAELVALVASALGVRRSQVSVRTGHRSPRKLVVVYG